MPKATPKSAAVAPPPGGFSSPVAADIAEGLNELVAFAESGRDPADVLTARTVEIPDPGEYGPAAVRALRAKLRASQPVFARLMGVSAMLVRGWEQGRRTPNPMARRMFDLAGRHPEWFAPLARPARARNGRPPRRRSGR